MLKTKTIQYELDNGIATITFDEENSPVNTMCLQWQEDLSVITQRLLQDKEQVKGVIFASNKGVFFAGADLKATMQTTPQDAPKIFTEIERIKKCFRTIETLGVPVVTCLNGTALGGGFELALVGHYRIALDDPKASFGLPEVTLGLIPGGGGITKMTRLLGLMAAQPYLVEGKLFGAKEGHKLGLIHEIVQTREQLRERALAYISDAQGKPEKCRQVWDAKEYKIPGGAPSNPKIAGVLPAVPAMLKQKTRGLYPAPEAIMACMVEGAIVDFDTAMRIESRYLAPLMAGQISHNMINTFFFNMNAIKSGASRPKDVAKYQPKKVGVLGAGMMGAGIAYSQASKGIETVLKDISIENAQKGKAYSEKITHKQIEKGRMTADKQKNLLDRILPTADVADLKDCDLIIEAVFEQRELKAQVTKEAEPLLAQNGFFASNTSTLPITGLAQASSNPEKFIGIHFFSPVDKMKLVEIIKGEKTNDETIAKAFDYVQALGKLPIVVNDSRGFYTSRTFGMFVFEGAAMLAEGIPAAAIENGAMQAGMPVGPLAVADETALTLSVHVLEQTRADYEKEGKKYESSVGELLVERMVKEFKRLGRAGGGGFYDYPQGGKKTLWSGLKTHFEKPIAYTMEDIKDRILYRQAIETARCLAEGVLTNVHDGNIGSIFGIGFPAWTGGALQFIYATGVDAFAKRSAELASKYGKGFELTPEVKNALVKHQPKY